MQNEYVLLTLLTISFVTIMLRAFPIILTRNLAENEFLIFISKRMPIGVMFLLVIYTLKDQSYLTKPFGIPILISCAISVILYLQFKSALLSIFTSLLVYLMIRNWDYLIDAIELI
jgi:branched-subunit amino acid transport protein AzlD